MLQNKTHFTGTGNSLLLFCVFTLFCFSFEFWSTHVDLFFLFHFTGRGNILMYPVLFYTRIQEDRYSLFSCSFLFIEVKGNWIRLREGMNVLVLEFRPFWKGFFLVWDFINSCEFMVFISVSKFINFTFDSSYIWFYLSSLENERVRKWKVFQLVYYTKTMAGLWSIAFCENIIPCWEWKRGAFMDLIFSH